MKKTIIMVLVMVMIFMMSVPVLACEEQSYDYLSEDMDVIMLWSYEEIDSQTSMYLPYCIWTQLTMDETIEEANEEIEAIREVGGMVEIVEDASGVYNVYIWDPETQPSPMECNLIEG